MDVAPVVLGEGVRFFGSYTGIVLLDDADVVIQGDRVLHLHYTVNADQLSFTEGTRNGGPVA